MRADWPQFCERLFGAAVKAAAPNIVVLPALPDPKAYKAVKVIAFGKAAAAMARAAELAWPDVALSGIAVCRYGYAVPCDRIEVMESAHPVPDAAATLAGGRALAIARSAGPDELLLVLVSGGGSSLLCVPAVGITLADKQRITGALLKGGAPIADINCVRRHLSAIKGGRLARAGAGARQIVTLAISDVVGDAWPDIASGPSVPDDSTVADATAILARYGIAPPPLWSETVKPDDPVFGKTSAHIIAGSQQMLAAAVAYGHEHGFDVQLLGHDLTGEAREVAVGHAGLVQALHGKGVVRPTLLLSGGELTVTVRGDGQGGPNQEYILALMAALPKDAPVSAFAADTDGMDGTGGAAGAWFTPHSRALAPDPLSWLDRNDSYNYFNDINCLFKVKHTLTNVNDLRAIALFPD